MKEFITSFGVPIRSRIEGGHTEEELQESISKKLSAMDASNFPSLQDGAALEAAKENGQAS